MQRTKQAGAEYAGGLVPLGTAEYSVYLIKAKAYAPNVLINVMGGGDRVNSLKQFVQFGLNKQMAVGGTLFELENVRAVPPEARVGWWTMEWWWDQPDNPHVKAFVADIKKATGKNPNARHWFGYVSRSEEHTSELQSPDHLVCRILLVKKKPLKDRNRGS